MNLISLRFALFIALLLASMGSISAGLVTECDHDNGSNALKLDPGTSQSFSDSKGCEIRSTGCDPSSGGDIWCAAGADLENSEVQLASIIFLLGFDSTSRSWMALHNCFYISGDPIPERKVRVTFTSLVDWKGRLQITETGPGQSEASIKIAARLIDDSNGEVVAEQRILDEVCEVASYLPTGCLKTPNGAEDLILTADMVVGRRYRFEIAAQCKSWLSGVGTDIICRFIDEAYGLPFISGWVRRSDLNVDVGRDYAFEIDQLREELNKLTNQFKAHSHIYKTGPGVAHNKDDAVTSLPENPNDH